jgi:DNA-binding LacI/PurR family transcriptional regulator
VVQHHPGRRPRAVFFRDDCICDMAIRTILELGIRVPQELSFFTHLSEGRQSAFPVPLSAVGFSTAHAASLSCDLLFRLIKDRSLPHAT